MQTEQKTLWIGPKLVDCTGVSPMKCMQVREGEDGEWTNFYESIAGFDYEEGYDYKIVVEVSDRENPPADASSKVYTLVEVVSKDEAEMPPAPPARGDLYTTTWRLRMYSDKGDTIRINEDQEVTLSVEKQTNRVSGKAACNNYFGQAVTTGVAFSVSGMGSTNKMCSDADLMKLEESYLDMLSRVTAMSPDRSRMLTLTNPDGLRLVFSPAPRE